MTNSERAWIAHMIGRAAGAILFVERDVAKMGRGEFRAAAAAAQAWLVEAQIALNRSAENERCRESTAAAADGTKTSSESPIPGIAPPAGP